MLAALIALAAAGPPAPGRADGEDAGERVEPPLVRDERPVAGRPPVARHEVRHDAVATRAVPDEDAAGA
jgi:hypothetical protein